MPILMLYNECLFLCYITNAYSYVYVTNAYSYFI